MSFHLCAAPESEWDRRRGTRGESVRIHNERPFGAKFTLKRMCYVVAEVWTMEKKLFYVPPRQSRNILGVIFSKIQKYPQGIRKSMRPKK